MKENQLFKEPTSDIERDDPFSGPKGFLVGGMALPSLSDLSQQYFLSANLLMKKVARNEIEDYLVANPILFLYRHSLELLFKSLLPKMVTGHSLQRLFELLSDRYKVQNIVVPEWIGSLIKDYHEYDPGSTSFRYGEKTLNVKVEGEVHVEFHHLQEAMTQLRRFFHNLQVQPQDYPQRAPNE